MNNIFAVKVLQTFDDFVYESVDECRLKTCLILLYEVEQIMLEILEDKIYFSLFLEGFLNTDNIVSFEHFKHFDLSLYSLA